MSNHVLFIVENKAVPHDTRVWLEAKAVQEMGHHVTVISRKEKFAEKSRETIDGIAVFRHPLRDWQIGKLGYFLEYALALFWQTVLAVRIYAAKPFQVIHAANPPDTIFLVALLFRPLGVRFVFDVHDLGPDLFSVKFPGKDGGIRRVLLLLEGASCRTASAIITTNRSYSRILSERHSSARGRTFEVRNDPMPAAASCGEGAGNPNGPLRILYLGSINRQDGVDNLLDVLKCLVEERKRDDFVCHVVGDGEALAAMRDRAAAMGLSERIRFAGYLYDKQAIGEHLRLADICVEPAADSFLNRHSTFIKILEYMMTGKPIVAFDLVESRFSAGPAALYASPGDTRAFADCVVRLMDDPGLRERMGREGLRRVREEFNWERSKASLLEAYARIGIVKVPGEGGA